MKNSSANAIELGQADSFSQSVEGSYANGPIETGSSTLGFNLSKPAETSAHFALAARIAGRINAASISDREVAELHRKRRILVERKYSSGLSRHDEHELRYIRWTLDRVEDAKQGYALDILEAATARYEDLLRRMGSLENQLGHIGGGRR